jgi:hypothetical protein
MQTNMNTTHFNLHLWIKSKDFKCSLNSTFRPVAKPGLKVLLFFSEFLIQTKLDKIEMNSIQNLILEHT